MFIALKSNVFVYIHIRKYKYIIRQIYLDIYLYLYIHYVNKYLCVCTYNTYIQELLLIYLLPARGLFASICFKCILLLC